MSVLAKNVVELHPLVPLVLMTNTFMEPHVSIAAPLESQSQMEKSVMLVSVHAKNVVEPHPPVLLVLMANTFMEPHV